MYYCRPTELIRQERERGGKSRRDFELAAAVTLRHGRAAAASEQRAVRRTEVSRWLPPKEISWWLLLQVHPLLSAELQQQTFRSQIPVGRPVIGC